MKTTILKLTCLIAILLPTGAHAENAAIDLREAMRSALANSDEELQQAQNQAQEIFQRVDSEEQEVDGVVISQTDSQ